MGERLVQYYDDILEKVGIKGRMRLAILTHIPLAQAEEEPDSQENITKFEEAIERILKSSK